MKVKKRDGSTEAVKLDKIWSRIKKQTYSLDLRYVEPMNVAKTVIDGLYDGISSEELDILAAETAASMTSHHPDYSILAARLEISRLQKNVPKSFYEVIKSLYSYIDPKSGRPMGSISEEVMHIVDKHHVEIEEAIIHDRDFNYDYFGYKTLEKSYLLKIHGKVAETPQHMLMRVSLGIHGDDIESAIKTYDLMSQKFMTHATPTLFNAGTNFPQMSSCFLLTMKDDSIDGIYDTLKSCAVISKNAGGIGLALHNIRAKGSYIKGTNGTSNGIIPMIKVFNETANYVDQGGGKRKGAFAMYLEPWHADIHDFLELKKNHGKEEVRARELFYALWVSDLFMKRVKENGIWTLMCPHECPGLSDVWGDEFETLYTKYESEGRGRQTIQAVDLWYKIIESQFETGMPYILFKDAANRKSNQQNLGTIKSSNLCAEILEYTEGGDSGETAVCNLASLSLSSFVNKGKFDYKLLEEVSYQAIVNLNKVIDRNYYPTPETYRSNMKHRPVGLGVQGLANVFADMKISFDSPKAKEVNKLIFETIYWGALNASADLAEKHGAYESFEGSPASKGILQFDMWNQSVDSNRYDWESLKKRIPVVGLRNSLLLAMMPTASTSQILGNNESFEPFQSNIFLRRTLSGEFPVVNRYLVEELIKLDIWDNKMKYRIIEAKGSVQNIVEIPEEIRDRFKTIWEIKQKDLVEMAADRGKYICQTQSMNLYIKNPNFAKMTSALFYGWEKGLKTGVYYTRTTAATEAIASLGIDFEESKSVEKTIEGNYNDLACSLDNPEACEACGS